MTGVLPLGEQQVNSRLTAGDSAVYGGECRIFAGLYAVRRLFSGCLPG